MDAQYRCLTGGGLGDAAMSVAKLFGSKKFRPNNTKIFHVDGNKCYRESVGAFYVSQGISHEFILIEGRNGPWVLKNYKKYDSFLGSHWGKITGCSMLDNINIKSWPIDPFPPLVYEKENIEIVINVSAGRKMNRQFDVKSIHNFIKKTKNKVTLIGKSEILDKCNFKADVKINKTCMREYVNCICSADVIISHAGFAAYLGAMTGKKIFMIPEQVSSHYKHPSWDMQMIDGLKNLELRKK